MIHLGVTSFRSIDLEVRIGPLLTFQSHLAFFVIVFKRSPLSEAIFEIKTRNATLYAAMILLTTLQAIFTLVVRLYE